MIFRNRDILIFIKAFLHLVWTLSPVYESVPIVREPSNSRKLPTVIKKSWTVQKFWGSSQKRFWRSVNPNLSVFLSQQDWLGWRVFVFSVFILVSGAFHSPISIIRDTSHLKILPYVSNILRELHALGCDLGSLQFLPIRVAQCFIDLYETCHVQRLPWNPDYC